MYTMRDLERILGHSRAQLRWRLAMLAKIDGLLDGQVVIGPKGRKEFAPAVVDMLRDLDVLANQSDKSLEEAARELAEKIKEEKTPGTDQATDKHHAQRDEKITVGDPLLRLLLEEKEKRLEEKEARIAQLESEVLYLRKRVEELIPLALPRPRQSWFSRLFARHRGITAARN